MTLGSKKPTRKENEEAAFIKLLIPSLVILVFYGVFSGRLEIKDALTFLTGLLGGAGIGINVNLKR